MSFTFQYHCDVTVRENSAMIKQKTKLNSIRQLTMSHHQKNHTVLLGTKRFDILWTRFFMLCAIVLTLLILLQRVWPPWLHHALKAHPKMLHGTGIFPYIYTIKFEPNVGKSFIHGMYGHVNMVNVDSKLRVMYSRHLDNKKLPSNKKQVDEAAVGKTNKVESYSTSLTWTCHHFWMWVSSKMSQSDLIDGGKTIGK